MKGLKPSNFEMMRGSVGAGAGAAEAAGIGQGMLDGAQAPALLVEHAIVDDAANGQFRVLLDRVVLEVFVAAIAIQEELPVRIALADAAAERQGHGGRFDIERLVILDDPNGFKRVERGRVGLDDLEEQPQPEPVQEGPGLVEVGARFRRRG